MMSTCSLASHMALLDISGGLATQIALSLVGIVAMIATAALLNLIRIKSRQQPHAAPSYLTASRSPPP
jgi:hypothetical protein